MADGGRGEDDSGDPRVAKDVMEIAAEVDARVFGADGFEGGGVLVAESAESAEFEEVAGKILAPVSMPYDCDVGDHGVSLVEV
jgi:hypothetical protein